MSKFGSIAFNKTLSDHLVVVDGTAKLAAKSKPSDKHEAPDLNIEEVTVASPRPSRKRTGEFFDFDNSAVAEPSSRPARSKTAKRNKTTKTAPADDDENSHEVEAKPAATAEKGKKEQGPKKKVAEPTSEMTTKSVEIEKRARKPKVVKDDSAGEKLESWKKSKKATKELAANKKPNTDTKSKPAKADTKMKAKMSQTEKDTAEQESSTVAPVIAMDEGPFETVLDSENGHAPEAAEKQAATGSQATKARKNGKKPAKESKASKIESAKASAAETAVTGTNITNKGAKVRTEKIKKAAKSKTPATERAADVADIVETGVKTGTEKAGRTAKSMAPVAETLAGVADVVKRDAKAGAKKLKKGARPKDSTTAKDDESVTPGESTEEQKPEASKFRKRKAPASADADLLKTDILDPLSEHASATKKQKKADTKSKSIGSTVGDILATASEGANAAKASLEGLANSIMGGASEAAEGATGAKKSAKASAQKAKGKGKATAEDLTESSGKTAANEEPGNAESEDDSDDEPDDYTTSLLAGFESEGDDVGPASSPGFRQGQKIPPLPQVETTTKKLENARNGANDGPGVVYVGRIPHGFYEHEMREYFAQFGDISRLRLSRSRKSGASKHYAFVEFTSAGVANIVADTMNNYLMFGHILKCSVVPREQVHESLWKGANKRFKPVPWNKIEGRKLEMGVGREQWVGRLEGENKRRASKNEKTKEIGYEFEARDLKGVDQVPVRDAAQQVENGEKVEEEKSLVTAGGEDGSGAVIVVSEEVKTKRVKKVVKKAESAGAEAKKTKRALDAGEEVVGSTSKKVKKGKNAAA